MAHIPAYEENQPRKQKRRIAWPMENYKKMPRNKVAVIEPLPRNKSGEVTQVSAISGRVSGYSEQSNKIIDENSKSSMMKKSKVSVLRKESTGNGNYPRFHNREKDARFARMKKNLKLANANGRRKTKLTKNRQSSEGNRQDRLSDSSSKRSSTTSSSSSSSSSDGSSSDAGSIPIPIHFKHDNFEFTKIVFSNVLEKDKLKYNKERSQ